MPPRFWSVRTSSKSYGYIGALAETAEEAIALVQALGHSKHDRAKRSPYPGKQTMLADGTFLANITYTRMKDGTQHPGWAVLGKAGGRGGYQQEVLRFISGEEAQSLLATQAFKSGGAA